MATTTSRPPAAILGWFGAGAGPAATWLAPYGWQVAAGAALLAATRVGDERAAACVIACPLATDTAIHPSFANLPSLQTLGNAFGLKRVHLSFPRLRPAPASVCRRGDQSRVSITVPAAPQVVLLDRFAASTRQAVVGQAVPYGSTGAAQLPASPAFSAAAQAASAALPVTLSAASAAPRKIILTEVFWRRRSGKTSGSTGGHRSLAGQ